MTSGDESGMETPGIDVLVLQALEADTSRELVPELVDVFVKSADTRRDQISADIAAGNLDGAAGQAHALKSSSATFGAMEVRRVSADLETACKSGDRTESERLAVELVHTLDTAKQTLKTYVAKITG